MHSDFNKIKQSCWTFALHCQGKLTKAFLPIRKPFAIALPHDLKLPADFYQF